MSVLGVTGPLCLLVAPCEATLGSVRAMRRRSLPTPPVLLPPGGDLLRSLLSRERPILAGGRPIGPRGSSFPRGEHGPEACCPRAGARPAPCAEVRARGASFGTRLIRGTLPDPHPGGRPSYVSDLTVAVSNMLPTPGRPLAFSTVVRRRRQGARTETNVRKVQGIAAILGCSYRVFVNRRSRVQISKVAQGSEG